MLALQLKVGDWIKQTTCTYGHVVGPAVVLHIHSNGRNWVVRQIFDKDSHSIPFEREVELCQSN